MKKKKLKRGMYTDGKQVVYLQYVFVDGEVDYVDLETCIENEISSMDTKAFKKKFPIKVTEIKIEMEN
ncbi:MAG: hypothetical protein KAS32_19435 [Candidatus Peribacteraceae bacterium]|nr:hypothetical protein [Candidatus Peribacteraceae bacterium]